MDDWLQKRAGCAIIWVHPRWKEVMVIGVWFRSLTGTNSVFVTSPKEVKNV